MESHNERNNCPYHNKFEKFALKSVCHFGVNIVKKGNYKTITIEDICDELEVKRCHEELIQFISSDIYQNASYSVFAVLLEKNFLNQKEAKINHAVFLKRVHEIDKSQGYFWNSSYSREMDNPNFAFCVGGEAFYPEVLFDQVAAPAKQTEFPVILFVPQKNIDHLRAKGLMQEAIRSIHKKIIENFGEEAIHPLKKQGSRLEQRVIFKNL